MLNLGQKKEEISQKRTLNTASVGKKNVFQEEASYVLVRTCNSHSFKVQTVVPHHLLTKHLHIFFFFTGFVSRKLQLRNRSNNPAPLKAYSSLDLGLFLSIQSLYLCHSSFRLIKCHLLCIFYGRAYNSGGKTQK